MGEMGKAMMGSAAAAGVDRARLAAEMAVASPLLEGIELSGARGVLVNITSSDSLGMKEVKEVMNTIRTYAAADATIIFGTVFEEGMEDQLRVTVVATGLGAPVVRKMPKPEISVVPTLRTGTDDRVYEASTSGALESGLPSVFQSGRGGARNATVDEMRNSGVDKYDIPAFLRKQAD